MEGRREGGSEREEVQENERERKGARERSVFWDYQAVLLP